MGFDSVVNKRFQKQSTLELTTKDMEQPFEKYETLTMYISNMAHSGICPSGSNWNAFLFEINNLCSKIDNLNNEIALLNKVIDHTAFDLQWAATELNDLRKENAELKRQYGLLSSDLYHAQCNLEISEQLVAKQSVPKGCPFDEPIPPLAEHEAKLLANNLAGKHD